MHDADIIAEFDLFSSVSPKFHGILVDPRTIRIPAGYRYSIARLLEMHTTRHVETVSCRYLDTVCYQFSVEMSYFCYFETITGNTPITTVVAVI